jgi:hypothetical protein
MNETERNEFYVGYLPQAPKRIARQVRLLCAALFGAIVVLAILLVIGQHKFPLSVFEFQQYRQFEGVVHAQPYPMLLVQHSGGNGKLPVISPYLLVAPGKHGAAAEVVAYDNQRVRLQGALIYRDGLTMIEILPRSIVPLNSDTTKPPIAAAAPEALGEFTLAGEIVDSKCYLGVMNPGHTKPHRECAARCISGGVPPLFIARDKDGQTVSLLLVSAAGAPVNQAVLDLVAEPVEITGQVVREAEQFFLRADPVTYRRLSN